MRRLTYACVLPLVLVLAVAVFLGVTGCERANGLAGLIIVPANVTLTPSTNTVVFTATGITNELALPLAWSVTDAALGAIIGTSGYTATYRATEGALGDNTVIVIDQFENEGLAIVRQMAEQTSLVLTAVETSEGAWTITATGGVAPYRWWVLDGSIGTVISGADSDTAVYTAVRAGVNVVHAEDAYGVLGTVSLALDDVALTLTATQADADTWTIVVDQGATYAPYEWWVSVPTNGSLDTTGNAQTAVYTAANDAGNTVNVRSQDSPGVTGSVAIP